jgi:hypothetical protein
MRSKLRSSFATAAAAALVLGSAGVAVADNVVADGDNVEPVASNALSLGTVCVEDSVTQNALVAVSRNGNYGSPNVFKDGSSVTVTVLGVTGTGLSAVMDPAPATITLTGWDGADNNAMSAAVGSKITFVAGAAPTSFSGAVNYRATGVRDNGTELTRDGSLAVSATVSNTGDCAPAPTDVTPPVVTPNVTGTLGDNGWYTSDVTVAWDVEDAESEVTTTTGCQAQMLTADTDGVTFTCSATSAGGTTEESVTIKRDATAPTVSWAAESPADGAIYYYGDTIPAADCSAVDATSGPNDCSVTAGGNSIGSHTLTAVATDNAGNEGTETRTYTVQAWDLDGFYQPVDKYKVNTVKAGSTVPLKFNVFKGNQRMTSGIGASFSAKKVNCEGGAIEDAIEEFTTTGKTELRYDADGQQWVQNWATPKAGAGSCYAVTMTTADGSTIKAGFKLK